MKTQFQKNHVDRPIRSSSGFTLIELLVAITVIGILVGMLAVGVQRALTRAKEFAVQQEMSQLGSAIEKFEIENGFYPPSFKTMTLAKFQGYINRIAPSNVESAGTPGSRPIDLWWDQIGMQLVLSANSDPVAQSQNSPGADLVFWLSGLAKNKQFPLSKPSGVPIAAHNYVPGGDGVERQVYFDFDSSRIVLNTNSTNPMLPNPIATYVQPSGREIAYLYRDAGANYLPSMPNQADSGDGAYLNPTITVGGTTRAVTIEDVEDAAVHVGGMTNPRNVTPAQSQMIFKLIYPNPVSFQLISFGLDGLPGGPPLGSDPNPNLIIKAGVEGADNMVNFGANGVGRLENLILDEE